MVLGTDFHIFSSLCAQTVQSPMFMAALCNRAGHYIFAVVSVLPSSFFSLPNLSGRRVDVYHTSTHGVPLERI